jgi:hypothetical protein
MRPKKFEFQVRHPRLWGSIVATVLGILAVWLIWQTFFVQSTNPRSHSPAPPSVAPQKLRPSSYQHTRRLFGPWQLAAPGSTGASHLVMLHANGGVDVSQKTVRVTDRWQRASANEIVAVVAGPRHVRIRTSDSNIFSLSYRQAFILAQRPDAVYAYLHNGPRKAQLVSTTVEALTR